MGENSAFFSSVIEKGQFRVDEKGHATLFDEFLFLIPPKVFIRLHKELEDRLGPEEADELLYELGKYQVEQASDRYIEEYRVGEISKQKVIGFIENILQILGWGVIDITELDKEEGHIRVEVRHPTLPSLYRNDLEEDVDGPRCDYLRGIIAQAAFALTDEEFHVEESQCAAVEGKECVFEGTTG